MVDQEQKMPGSTSTKKRKKKLTEQKSFASVTNRLKTDIHVLYIYNTHSHHHFEWTKASIWKKNTGDIIIIIIIYTHNTQNAHTLI